MEIVHSKEVKCREQLPKLLNKLGLLDEIVEVGAWRGEYTLILRSIWDGKLVTVVDYYDQYEGFREDPNILKSKGWMQLKLAKEIMLHRMSWFPPEGFRLIQKFSNKACIGFKNESLDMVYIDGNHAYEYAKEDLFCWWPKLRKGGIMAMHDTEENSVWPGVRKAMLEFCTLVGIKKIEFCFGEAHTSWFYK